MTKPAEATLGDILTLAIYFLEPIRLARQSGVADVITIADDL